MTARAPLTMDAAREPLLRDEVDASANLSRPEQRLRREASGSALEGTHLSMLDADEAAKAIKEQMLSHQRKRARRLPDTMIGALVMGHAFALLLLYYVLWRPSSILGSFAFTIFLASTCGGLLFLTTGRTVESIAPEPSPARQEAHKLRDHRGWLVQSTARRIIKFSLAAAIAPFMAYLFFAKAVMRSYPVVVRFVRESEMLPASLAPLRARFFAFADRAQVFVARFIEQLKARLRARKAQAARTAKVAKENVKEAANDASAAAARTADSIKFNAKVAKENVKDTANDVAAAVARKADDGMMNALAAKEAAKEGVNDFVDVAAEKAEDAKFTTKTAAYEAEDQRRQEERFSRDPLRG